jgi:Tfp pilus assembly protein PilF
MQEYDTTLKLDPNYMPAFFQVGHVAALANTNLPRGEESLKKYLGWHPAEDDPPLFRAYYWLGYIYEREGNRAAAKQNYEKSLSIKPGQKDVQERLKGVQ